MKIIAGRGWIRIQADLVALALIIKGIAMIFGAEIFYWEPALSMVWIFLIGLFLNQGAIFSYRQVIIQCVSDDVMVQPIMQTGIPTVPENMTINRVIEN